MTRQKSKVKKLNQTATNLQKKFLEMPQNEQQGITNFFNLHNAAHYIYDNLSDAAKDYVNYCINLSVDADKKEQNNSAHV